MLEGKFLHSSTMRSIVFSLLCDSLCVRGSVRQSVPSGGVQLSASTFPGVDTAVTVRWGPAADPSQMGFIEHLAALRPSYTTTSAPPVLERRQSKHTQKPFHSLLKTDVHDNFRAFCFTVKSLHFSFQQYQMAHTTYSSKSCNKKQPIVIRQMCS